MATYYDLNIQGGEVQLRLDLASHNVLAFDGLLDVSVVASDELITSADSYQIVYAPNGGRGEMLMSLNGAYYRNFRLEVNGKAVLDSAWYNTDGQIRRDRLFLNGAARDIYAYAAGAFGKVERDGVDGIDGITPHIDPATRHWMIGEADTGILARGTDGESAYQAAVNEGYQGTQSEWIASLHGQDGKSAYEIWAEEPGNEGKTVSEFLASLKESGFGSKAVTERPETNIDTNTIYCIPNPNNTNEWTEEIYDTLSGWIVLAAHVGRLADIMARLQELDRLKKIASGVGLNSSDAVYTVIEGHSLTPSGTSENSQFSYSTPISLSKGDTILAKMCSGAALAIAVTDSQGTSYRLGVVGEDNLLAKEYKYTALEDCYVAICWRSKVSAPEYVKIVSNGTLTNVLNLYKDVSLSRKFTFDTNESVLSGQITFVRTISPTIKAGSKIKLTANAITGTWTRLLVYYNGDVQNHRVKDNMVSGEEYIVTLPEDAYSFGYFLTTEESVRFTIEIQELTDTDQLREDVNNRIDGIGGIIETLEDNTIGSTDRTVNTLSNRGCFPVSTSATKNLGDIYSYTGASLIQIPVSEGDVIETNAKFDGSFGACTYDSNYQPLSSGTLTAPTTVVRGMSSTPSNPTKQALKN